MTNAILYVTGVVVTFGLSLVAVGYLRAPLQGILVELCGTGERARFWVAFANVTLMLVPVIFAMASIPELPPGTTAVLQVAAQLKWALAALFVALLVLGFILSRFIVRQPVPPPPVRTAKEGWLE